MDAFCNTCVEKLWYKDGEQDMVMMNHLFTIEDKSGKERVLHSTLVMTGDPEGTGGYSCMAKTVGYPTALACLMILNGEISQKGV